MITFDSITYDHVTNVLEGFNGGELVLIGSAPSLGKTTLALSLTDYLMKVKNFKVCFFSIERSNRSLEELISKNALEMNSSNLDIIDKADLKITELSDIIKNRVKANNVKLCVIDYLELLAYNDSKQNFIETVNFLKSIALDLNIIVLVLMQIKRKPSGFKPELAHFNPLDNIADLVIALYKNTDTLKTELLVLK